MRALVLVAIAGCGPSLRGLVADRHYREAICGAVDGDAGDRSMVAAALERDAEPYVHVTWIPREGDLAAAQFLRVELQTNIVPIDDLTVEIGLVGTARPVTLKTLAELTGEHLPPQHVESTYNTGANFLRGSAAVLSMGISLLFTRFQAEGVWVDAPDSEVAAAAPRAHRMIHSLPSSSCGELANTGEGTGARCTWYYVMPGAAAPNAQLAVTLRYGAKRVTEHSDGTCTVDHTTTVPLVAQTGPAMHPLRHGPRFRL